MHKLGIAISVRPAVSEDIVEIKKLEDVVNPTPLSQPSLLAAVDSHDIFWVLTDDETDSRIFAFVLFAHTEAEIHIHEIAVQPEFQRKQLGAYLLRKVISYSIKNKIPTIYLEVRAENAVAIAFYESLGFIKIHKKAKFYSDGADAFSMIFKLGTETETVDGPETIQ